MILLNPKMFVLNDSQQCTLEEISSEYNLRDYSYVLDYREACARIIVESSTMLV